MWSTTDASLVLPRVALLLLVSPLGTCARSFLGHADLGQSPARNLSTGGRYSLSKHGSDWGLILPFKTEYRLVFDTPFQNRVSTGVRCGRRRGRL